MVSDNAVFGKFVGRQQLHQRTSKECASRPCSRSFCAKLCGKTSLTSSWSIRLSSSSHRQFILQVTTFQLPSIIAIDDQMRI
jgi:hypothetical protein